MIGLLGEVVKTKEGKALLIGLGGTIAVLTAIHYYHQIKLTRLKIKEIEN